MTFQQQIQAIQRNATRHEARMLQASRNVLDTVGPEGITFAKINHPWQNRTGEAERGLAWQSLHPPRLLDGGRGAFVGRAPHNKWLEISHGSRYQILQTTWALFGAELRRRLSEVWRT